MKYSVEVKENGFVETLEIDGIKYNKKWSRTGTGFRCKDEDFCEQLEKNGDFDEIFLDEIFDKIDNSFFSSDVADIER